jgi:glutamate--cysteine ligase catalytic subunit
LADVDARWNVIAASVDDRTEEERGIKVRLSSFPLAVIDGQPLKNDRYRIPKSRYDSVDLYISTDERNLPEYHDIDVPMDQSVRKRLIDHGTFLFPKVRS